jgi:hypothetical protein
MALVIEIELRGGGALRRDGWGPNRCEKFDVSVDSWRERRMFSEQVQSEAYTPRLQNILVKGGVV